MLFDLLQFAKAMERESQTDKEDADGEVSPRNSRRVYDKRRFPAGGRSGEALTNRKFGNRENSNSRSVLSIRPTSPKSPAASVFGSIEGSDDAYMDSNWNAMSSLTVIFFFPFPLGFSIGLKFELLKNQEISEENANGEQMSHASTSMIRSHSVSGGLHGVQPDPIAADILRKKPEHETFARLKIINAEKPTPDEVESYMALQKCLELRESYIFREVVAPWEKEVISDPSTPKPNRNPFQYYPVGKSDAGYSSPTQFAITEDLGLSTSEALMIVSIPNIIGWLIISFAKDCSFLYTGRLLEGFGVGMISYTVFGENAFKEFGKAFILLHFSDQHPGTQKKKLVFRFALPDVKRMADMTRLDPRQMQLG